MKLEDIKIGMKVKIHLDKNEDEYDYGIYNGKCGKVSYIDNNTDDDFKVEVDVEKLDYIDEGVLFKAKELEEVK